LLWRSGLTADFHDGFMTPTHVYEVRSRKDKRGVDLISDALPSVACGTLNQTQSAMQSTTRSIAAAYTML
jgi:hypothetical protein